MRLTSTKDVQYSPILNLLLWEQSRLLQSPARVISCFDHYFTGKQVSIFLAFLHKPSADEFDIVKHCNSVSGAEWPQTTRSLLCGHEMTY